LRWAGTQFGDGGGVTACCPLWIVDFEDRILYPM
jgi:hypothetical protein